MTVLCFGFFFRTQCTFLYMRLFSLKPIEHQLREMHLCGGVTAGLCQLNCRLLPKGARSRSGQGWDEWIPMHLFCRVRFHWTNLILFSVVVQSIAPIQGRWVGEADTTSFGCSVLWTLVKRCFRRQPKQPSLKLDYHHLPKMSQTIVELVGF